VIFVTVKKPFVFFDPASINIFLAELIGFFFPGFGSFTSFYLFVFLPGIALPGCFDKAGINDLACFGEDTLVIECLVETIEQGCNNLLLYKGFAELPDGFAVRNSVT
jgi:hypothetical protein